MEIKTKTTKYSSLKDLGLLVNSEVVDNFSHIHSPKMTSSEKISALRRERNDDDIKKELASCVSLVLGITEKCNFRCKYCVYDGVAPGERGHTDNAMDFETAQKAVDLFLKLIMQDTWSKKRKKIYIGFYGGEPLLEFNLIKRIIKYFEEAAKEIGFYKRFDALYRMTTNGALLNDEKVDYLKEKDVVIDVSLDGPEEEHDKFRVNANGRKTWAKIMKNLSRIKERYPDYYDRKISCLVTLHPLHNGKEIDRFFLENAHNFSPIRTRFNQATLYGLTPEYEKFLEKNSGHPSELAITKSEQRNIERKFKLYFKNPKTTWTATCFPGGERIFVSASGTLSVCERTRKEFPNIGHVNTGIDLDRIRQIIKEYNEEIIQNKCWECDYWFLCNVCLANAYRDGGFKFDCQVKKSAPPAITNYLKKKESEDEKKYSDFYNGVNNSIVDFIEQL